MLIIILIIITLVIGVSLFIASHSYQFPKEENRYTPAKYGYEFDELSIPTANNKNLYGWWVPAENPEKKKLPTIILIHGWSRNVDRMMSYIKQLHPVGYNLLAFDSRCHGRSDDDKFSSMLKYTEDIGAALDFAEKMPYVDTDRLGLLGLSMGGAASIYRASLDKRVKTVITIGAFSHPEKVMGLEFKRHRIPYIPFVWLIFRYMELRIGKRFKKFAPVNNIVKSKAKILLIHGVDDQTAPIEHADDLYKRSNHKNTTIWKIEGKGHSNCNHHPEFWPKVSDFLKNSL